jgi:hypothetical protein
MRTALAPILRLLPAVPSAAAQPGARKALSRISDPTQHLRISFRNKGNGGNIVGFRCVLPDSEETRKLLR